jgi:hypothetical protein
MWPLNRRLHIGPKKRLTQRRGLCLEAVHLLSASLAMIVFKAAAAGN